MPQEKIGEGWHLDKRVPVVLIITLISYAVIAVWQLSQLRSEITQNTNNIVRIEQQTDAEIARVKEMQRSMQSESVSQGRQLSRIEEQIIGLRRDLTRYLESNGE